MAPVARGEGSLARDGRHLTIHPADVQGPFTRRRRWIFALLIAIYAALPWISIGGHPAVFLDVAARRFFLFGLVFNAQDAWLSFFLLAGAGLALLLVTVLFGRLWCGYACPQTVFLEGVFRRLERWIEGPAASRVRLAAAPWGAAKLGRKLAKHAAFVLLATAVAHIFISYFVSLPRLFAMMRHSPGEHAEAFAWVLGVTAAIYFDMAWFREQMCVVICPYGRLQSVLTDRDSLVIGYDEGRGEPRGKLGHAGAGDCVDCHRCVAVCPTAIDIRDGLQLDCVGCAACVDACDEVMVKLGRRPGLVRYASARTLAGEARRILRPRVLLTAGLLGVVLIASAVGFGSHEPFEANLLRQRGEPYHLEATLVRNAFELHLVNKTAAPARFAIAVTPAPGTDVVVAEPAVELASLASRTIPVFVTVARAVWQPGGEVELTVRMTAGQVSHTRVVRAPLLGPNR